MLYLTLRHYEYVCAVARHGSLSAAADAVHVSQPALSAALSRIEEHLGHALFLRRRGAALALTPQGRRFAGQAQALLDQAARLENSSNAGAMHKMTLVCFSDLAPFLLAPALKALRAALPDVEVSHRACGFEPLISALSTGAADLAITYDLGLDAAFSRAELDRIAPHALVPPEHPLAQRRGLSLAELSQHPLVLSQEGLSVQHMLGLFKMQGLVPRIAHRAETLELLRSLAANGEGVGISYSLPPGGISYDGKALCAVPVTDAAAQEPVILAAHTGMPEASPAFKAHEILRKALSARRSDLAQADHHID
ncbi:LysR family transcriptional regulator [Leisingera aquaemixtae]|uniref:HTH-type transcriptional regulator GltC n=1 Tax=Leisingera aquaemixtae TaxID=1396826 RepID=A0A0P1H741_9RHOB|nr:LysR family transcriptional regulator [Leisingera aquaemixtae]CUH98823.1 HTH-type transcriptional regulator GltC [Leisingera aquaemixtae]